MIKLFTVLILSFCLMGCTTAYHFYYTNSSQTPIHEKPDVDNNSIGTLPYNELIVLKGKKKTYNFIEHNGVAGYILTDKLRYSGKASKSSYEHVKLKKSEHSYNTSSVNKTKDSTLLYNNSSIYTPKKSSTGGPVHVKGYTRKDGTYVKPHTRSAPKRKG